MVSSARSATWEKIRTDAGATPDSDVVAHGTVLTIADYIVSIQAK
jgi:hypothetical protein